MLRVHRCSLGSPSWRGRSPASGTSLSTPPTDGGGLQRRKPVDFRHRLGSAGHPTDAGSPGRDGSFTIQPRRTPHRLGRREPDSPGLERRHRATHRRVAPGAHRHHCSARLQPRRTPSVVDELRQHERLWDTDSVPRSRWTRPHGVIVECGYRRPDRSATHRSRRHRQQGRLQPRRTTARVPERVLTSTVGHQELATRRQAAFQLQHSSAVWPSARMALSLSPAARKAFSDGT